MIRSSRTAETTINVLVSISAVSVVVPPATATVLVFETRRRIPLRFVGHVVVVVRSTFVIVVGRPIAHAALVVGGAIVGGFPFDVGVVVDGVHGLRFSL